MADDTFQGTTDGAGKAAQLCALTNDVDHCTLSVQDKCVWLMFKLNMIHPRLILHLNWYRLSERNVMG